MAALIIALLEHPEQHAQVKGCLELAGHEVVFVDSFQRAKAVLREHYFDLIISDVHLENGGSAFDFLKWVKSKPALHPIPFVTRDFSALKFPSDPVTSTSECRSG